MASSSGFMAELIRIVRTAIAAGLRSAAQTRTRQDRTRPDGTTARQGSTTRTSTGRTTRTSTPDPAKLNLTYAPKNDGTPDPGEIVWTWVPYEEDDGRGKDRPVLVIARRRGTSRLVGLMLTSKDHDRKKDVDQRYGRYWMDIGAGDWDSSRRPSEIRLDRLIDVDPKAVRRETALDKARFDQVAAAFRELHEK